MHKSGKGDERQVGTVERRKSERVVIFVRDLICLQSYVFVHRKDYLDILLEF